ncbi:PREDICTED: uncharacterized protein LOC105555888 [Vollenhovia emeryi]|uniref:uncharacterized protein LOC105555888 n=1 Tax=Vollenhovia emeryi TaxID=411798 RepID=UPI0005F57E2D|nr:PREDICTED: uncharacterized protein LOC105555888 [Vollenhovia emeryi]
MEQIPNILLRFRQHKIGIASDIRKAFLQISISPEDRDVLRFLWWKETLPDQIEIYRHRRVVFGVTSSPFLLGGTVEYHLGRMLQEAGAEQDKKIIQQLMKSFYVDNCVTSLDSEIELFHFIDVAKHVMARGNFDLRGWEYSGQQTTETMTSVLGLRWNKAEDTLGFTPSLLKPNAMSQVTKRAILSAAQRTFDPIGVASPVFLKPKLLLQKLWTLKLGWDETVPEEIKVDFDKWQQHLWWLEKTAHSTANASQDAYAAVIFARTEECEGTYVQLIAAKVRVAPVERPTIPRLELLAATIGARLWHAVKSALDLKDAETFFWSDSTTVLAWIHRDKPWNTFVYNRVREIRKFSDSDRWRQVPGTMNPADLPSRGCTAKHLVESRWWEGPAWLKLSEEHWPSIEYVTNEAEIDNEMKKSTRCSNNRILSVNIAIGETNMLVKEQETGWYMKRQSRYLRIVRTMAWILRFAENCRTSQATRLSRELTAKEFATAEHMVLKLSQQESFDDVDEPRLNTLDVYKDDEGLLRLKSPIVNREDEHDFRYPIVLDQKHPLTKKLIEYKHQQLNHAGIQIVMSNLREKFWILSCRMTVRSVLNRCFVCKRYKIKKLDAISGSLPRERVKDAGVFQIVGIDYVGPLFLKEAQKTWICLYTCAVYRAIHLELTTSLSTEAFLQALRRFIARRGRPSVIYTDNGTNFVGARNLLHRIDWEKVQRYSSAQRIEWRLNPPTAAWWGGWWERLVKIVKDILRRTLKRACLSYEEMSTILCDCEAIVNSRPLTYLAEDPTQPVPLTPMMFLQEVTQNEVPDLDKLDVNLNRRMRYRQSLRHELRKRFRSEYLGQLSRLKNKSNCTAVKSGDIVLIGQDNMKRMDWPLARVIETFPGRDGIVRVVKVKTSSGELVRPIQRLYPLEVSSTVMEVKDGSRDSTVMEMKDGSKESTTPDDEIRTRYGRLVKKPDRFTV